MCNCNREHKSTILEILKLVGPSEIFWILGGGFMIIWFIIFILAANV